MSLDPVLEQAYPSVVGEISRRLLVCEEALASLVTHHEDQDAWIGSDLVTLQMRKICEMFMLGSALAHIWISDAILDLDKWHPKDIFSKLNDINKYPLPIPVELTLHQHASGNRQILPASKPMPFSILSKIYGRCNDLLHIPSASRVLTGKIQPFNVPQFQSWVFGFKRIVAGHILMMPKGNRILLCTWSGDQGMTPSIYLMETDAPTAFDTANLSEFELLSI